MPFAISLISRSRCAIAVSFVRNCWRWRIVEEVCWRVEREREVSASVSSSKREGLAYGFWCCCWGREEDGRAGEVRPPRVRSFLR